VEAKRRLLAGLSDDEALALLYDWEFWARPEQIAPAGDWFVWLLRSGRGFGKTRTGAEWVISRAASGFRRIALVGQSKADCRDTMIEVGESAILRVSAPRFMPHYEPSKRRLTWPNGAVAMVYSGDEPDQLRGPQHDSAWVDELAKFKYPQQTWDNLMFGLRIGARPQVVVTTTPRPIPVIKQLMAAPTTVDVQRSSYDNLANLAPVYVREVLERYKGARLGRQEIEGAILDDAPGALWTRDWIEAGRVVKAPQLERIVVAVDPAVTTAGDAAGIVAAGTAREAVRRTQHLYVLEDATVQGSPLTWATAAVTTYHKLKADRIVAEVNNGGELVEAMIRQVDASVPYKAVHASRGKVTRAEPVAAIYEQGRGHHVGMYAQLEDELCQWEPGGASPNRLDALVWAGTELMLEGGTPAGYAY